MILSLKPLIPLVKKKFQFRYAWKYHLLGWFFFIIYDTIIGGLARGGFGTFGNYAIHYVINIGLFYLHTHVILATAFNNTKHAYYRVPMAIILETVLYISFTYSIDFLLAKYTRVLGITSLPLTHKLIFAYLWRGLYFIFFSTGYYLFLIYKMQRDQSERSEKEKLDEVIMREKVDKELAEAKNAFLLAQVNPHFIFNTLNYIHYLTHKDSPDASKAIMALAKIMRYTAQSENPADFVNITEELEHINTLIYLHLIRYDNSVTFNLNYQDNIRGVKIIPFVLITLVENIFKHGNLRDKNYPPLVKIRLLGNNLIFETQNLIKHTMVTESLNSGLINISNRLKYAYGDNSHFSYGTFDGSVFKVMLKISLSDIT